MFIHNKYHIPINSVVRSGNDGSLCAVNPLFLAIVVDYAFVVIPVSQTGRIDFQCNKVIGHTGQILDLKWNPFNDCVIASASDDCSVNASICNKHNYNFVPLRNSTSVHFYKAQIDRRICKMTK